ncbi:glycosyltransferase [Musicola paradisiaca]|uniref:Glycosyl transferase family 28 n=1 Tax=Musicola paradisiaca (strain Ech703) TaxID=579405 RepID=C6C959_MUSP7|nr:nucleotide disphospho-sugar-binding domain-containing protein [Musicola paradisiaca]ACS86259.1 glycosyl transferase family 28 [Musicola paradisiaca Ech703]
MKIFLATLGSAGDVYPFIAIGESLIQAGHDVYLCTNPYFEKTARDRKLHFIPVGSVDSYYQAVNSQRLWHHKSSYKEMCYFINTQQKMMYDALAPHVDNTSVILTSLWAFSAKMLGETKGCCIIPVRVTPSTFISSYDPPYHKKLAWIRHLPLGLRRFLLHMAEKHLLDRELAPFLNEFRNGLGLPHIERVITRWTHKTDAELLCLFPQWFASPLPDWPANLHQVGFPLFNLLNQQEQDETGAFIAQAKTVILMPSWALQVNTTLIVALAKKIRRLGYQCLVVGAPNPQFGDDSGIRFEKHINLAQYLHQFKAIIHHGGIGTIAQSFAAGIPQMVLPSAFDQFDNARRVTAMKCGLSLTEAEAGHMDRRLKRLLNDPDIAENCQRIRARFLAEPAVDTRIVNIIQTAHARHLSHTA